MNYHQMLRSLYGARRLGVRFELSRVEAALAKLGDPHRRIGHVVHVGGTNGKGSTAAFVESILRAAGLKTGLYTSPHLARFTERIRIGGGEVDGDRLAARYDDVAAVAGELTFFEQVTLLAFVTFAEAGVDATVLEVGLGGRLDATNVVDADVAVVTGVAFDHVDVLGASIEAIAAEKAGIFKPGRAAVIGASGLDEGVPLLVTAAERAGCAPVVVVGRDLPRAIPEDWPIGLRGTFQRTNAACALAAIEALPARIPEATRRAGLAAARWPGRLEEIGDRPRIWLDAAHNPHGAAALSREIAAAQREAGRVIGVVAVSSDKDAEGIAGPVGALCATLIATQAPSARAMPADELARRIGGGAIAIDDPAAAVDAAIAGATGPDDLVVVFGSIFLVGAVRARLLGEAVDAIHAQDPPASGPTTKLRT